MALLERITERKGFARDLWAERPWAQPQSSRKSARRLPRSWRAWFLHIRTHPLLHAGSGTKLTIHTCELPFIAIGQFLSIPCCPAASCPPALPRLHPPLPQGSLPSPLCSS